MAKNEDFILNVNTNVDDVSSKFVSLRKQVKDADIAFQQASATYGEYSKEALDAAKNVAKLRDAVGDAKAQVDAFKPGGGLKAIAEIGSVAASGFAAATGAMSLFGIESDSTEKALLKVQSAMAFAQGLSGLADAGDALKNVGAAIKANSVIAGIWTSITGASTVATVADTAATEVNTVALEVNNVATQQGILAKGKEVVLKGASTVATAASSAATSIATAAQWLWNIAVSSNPIVALVVALASAAAGIYMFTKYLIDSSEANDKAAKSTAQHVKDLEKQSLAADKSTNGLKAHNDQQYAMAKAAGASSEELRKLSIKHAEEEIALNKANATIASNTFIRERNTLAMLKQSGASSDVLDAQKKLTDDSYKELQKQNKNLTDSYAEKHVIENKNQVEIIQERTERTNKANAATQKKAATKKKNKKEAAKKLLDDDIQSAKDAISILNTLRDNAETPAQREEREYLSKKAILEKNNLSTEELTKQHIATLKGFDDDAKQKLKESEQQFSDFMLGFKMDYNRSDSEQRKVDYANAISDNIKKSDEEIKVIETQFSKEGVITKEGQDKIDAIIKQRDDNAKVITANNDEIEREASINKWQERLQIATEFLNQIGSMMDQADNQRISNIQNVNQQETTDLDNKQQAELSKKGLTEAQKKAIDDKYTKLKLVADQKAFVETEKIKRAQFERDKKIKMAEIVMNTASGVMADWSKGAILGGPLSIATLAMGALQLAAIASTSYQGGTMPSGGGGGGIGSGGGGTVQQSESVTPVNKPSDNNIARAAESNMAKENINQIITVNAIVSETEMTEAQLRIRRIENNASL